MPGGKKKKVAKPSSKPKKSKLKPSRKKKRVKPRKPSIELSADTGSGDGKYRALIENSPVCIHEIDMDGALMSMNAAGLSMLCVRDESEIAGMAYLDTVCDKDRGRIEKLLHRAYKGHSSHFEFTSKGAKPLFFSSCFIPIKDKDGSVLRLMGITEDVTEQKILHEKLASEEKRYRLLWERMPIPYQSLDGEGKFLEVNKVLLERLGYEREDLIGTWFGDLIAPKYKKRFKESFPRFKERGESKGVQFELRRKDGSYIAVEYTGGIGYDFQGKFKQTHCIWEDVTERKKAEETIIACTNQQKAVSELGLLALSSIELSELFDKTVNVLAQSLDVDYCKILELLPDGMAFLLRAGAGWRDGLVGKAVVGADKDSQAGCALHSGEPVIVDDLRTETRFSGPALLRDHNVVSGMSVIIKGKDKSYGVLGAHTVKRQSFTQDDINFLQSIANILAIAIERKKAERSLQESEKRFALAQKIANIGTWELDFSSYRFTVSDEVEPMFGISAGEVELTYDNFFKALHYDDRSRVVSAINANIKENKECNVEYRILWPDKTIHWISVIGSVFHDASGKPLRMVGTIQEITGRKRAEEALKDALELGRKIIAKSPVGIVIYDESGQCLDANESIVKILGATKERMLQQNYHHTEAWKESGLYEKAVSAIEDNSIKRHDARIKTTLGKDVTLDCFLVPFMATGKRQLLVMVNDITERKRAEEALREAKERAEKATKAKDRYVSLIAHDLKSPFISIVTLLELLAGEKDDPAISKHRELIDAVHDASKDAMEVIDDVLHASRFESGRIELNQEFMDGNIEAFTVIANYGHLASEKGIKLINDVPRNTRLYADHLLFREVLNNLASNAIKFCGKGDTITFYIPSEERSTIAVKDTGVGMDKDTLANIFRHDVKTTFLGTAGERGTGIGLPFCAGIMEEHGGELAAESVKGEGSVFYARLLYVKPKVLVVDDEARARHEVAKLLEKIDVDVVEAENGRGVFEALEKDSPHLIVLDIYLPDADGLEILKRLKAENNTANIPVIIITSDDRIEIREKAIRLGAVDFVSKPVKPEELIPRARNFVS